MRKYLFMIILLCISPAIFSAETAPVYLTPLNYVGLWLSLLGITLMIFELFVFSFGIVGSIGLFALIFGTALLFKIPGAAYQLSWTFIALIILLWIILFFIVFTLYIKSHKRKSVTGAEGLLGSEGYVIHTHNNQISVRVLGEIWQASSAHMLKTGDKIKVIKVQGLKLTVEPLGE